MLVNVLCKLEEPLGDLNHLVVNLTNCYFFDVWVLLQKIGCNDQVASTDDHYMLVVFVILHYILNHVLRIIVIFSHEISRKLYSPI